MSNKSVSVIGAGSWGTALACAFSRAGNDVLLWAREEHVVSDINTHKRNSLFLADIPLPDNIRATSHLEKVAEADIVIQVVPSQFLRDVCEQLTEYLADNSTPIVSCSKGIEQYSLKLMTEIIEESFPNNPLAVLSGPSFAEEVGKDLATAVTLACANEDITKQLAETLSSTNFRIYSANDIIGAQIGGAVKNVIAIACGIALGNGMGNNARAAIITRGLAEMRRLGIAKGAKVETMMGLAGAGDIILTCGSEQSRNMSLGKALGEGKSLDEILDARGNVVTEGVANAQSIIDLAQKLDIDMPICKAVHGILYKSIDIETTTNELLNRPIKQED